jgi:hypothetical protein
MLPSISTAALRAILQDHLTKLLDDLTPLLEAHVAERAREARERARTETADALNQAARRLRQAADFTEVVATLADAAGAHCNGAAVLRVSGDRARGERIRGVGPEAAGRFETLDLALAEAPALSGAVAARDQVVAMSTAAEVSPALVEIAGHGEDGRVFIFPLVRDDRVEALLYCWGNVQGAPLELLAQMAGLCLPAPPPAEAPAALVSIAAVAPAGVSPAAAELPAAARAEVPPAPAELPAARAGVPPAPAELPAAPGPRPAPVSEWAALPPEEQRAHLRAQRFARVQVAEMRLFQAEAVLSGRMHRDLYGALGDSIDAAREKFRRNFLATCPSMIDYLHQELVRTLANDNPKLLGAEYPGALV